MITRQRLEAEAPGHHYLRWSQFTGDGVLSAAQAVEEIDYRGRDFAWALSLSPMSATRKHLYLVQRRHEMLYAVFQMCVGDGLQPVARPA